MIRSHRILNFSLKCIIHATQYSALEKKTEKNLDHI